MKSNEWFALLCLIYYCNTRGKEGSRRGIRRRYFKKPGNMKGRNTSNKNMRNNLQTNNKTEVQTIKGNQKNYKTGNGIKLNINVQTRNKKHKMHCKP